MPRCITLFLVAGFFLSACKPKAEAPAMPLEPMFYQGADISWVTEMEAAWRVFYNTKGQPQDLFVLLKEMGLTMIRLRVWVSPPSGYNSTADVVAKAKRAHAAGLALMIDFHYSDTWADPGQQSKPAAWADYSFSALKGAVYTHTRHVLDTLRQVGIIPKFVQVGNETANGMLWPDGQASTHMAAYAALTDTGYAAVKSVDTTMKVVVHLHNGFDNGLYRWLFDGLQAHKARYDVIGMSLYPTPANYKTLVSQCLANVADMKTRYGKPVIVTEVGMRADSAAACRAFLKSLTTQLKALPDGQGQGVLYWEPQAYNWQAYPLGAWQANGRPTQALLGLVP